MHGVGAQHLRRERGNWTTHENVQLRDLWDRLNRFFKAGATGQHRGEADLSVETKTVMHSWAAEIRINDKNAHIALGENAGEVDGNSRLAFRRRCTGKQDDLWFTPRNR